MYELFEDVAEALVEGPLGHPLLQLAQQRTVEPEDHLHHREPQLLHRPKASELRAGSTCLDLGEEGLPLLGGDDLLVALVPQGHDEQFDDPSERPDVALLGG